MVAEKKETQNQAGLRVPLAESKQKEAGGAGNSEPNSAHLPHPQSYQGDLIQTQ